MAKLLASSQITIVDLNDAVSLQSYITSTHPRVQFLNNNGTYIPNLKSDPVILNAELYKMGDRLNLVTNQGNNVLRTEWYVKISPSTTYEKITAAMTDYELIGTAPFFKGLKVKNNIMNQSKPGCTFKCEIDFKEHWMLEPHTQTTEIDFTLSIQGNTGQDAYTPILTNSNHSIICASNGTPESGEIGANGRAISDTLVYKGTKSLAAVTGTPGTGQYSISLANTNCTTGKKDADTFYVDTLTSSSSKGGKVVVTFNLEGTTTMTQEMTFSKVLHGANGSSGTSAKYVNISGEQAFKYAANFSGTPTPAKIILSRTLIGISGGSWQYHDGTNWVAFNPVQSGATIEITPSLGHFATNTNKVMRVRYFVDNNVNDEMSIVKVADGANGSSGTNAYTVVLSNPSHTVPANSSGVVTSTELAKATTDIIVYRGSTVITPTVSNPVIVGTGATFTTTNNKITMTAFPNNIDTATITVNVLVGDNQTIKQTFTVTKAKQGATGGNGSSAKVLQISGGVTVIYKANGTTDPASSITLTAIKKNTSGVVLWKVGSDAVVKGDTYLFTVNKLASTNSVSIRAEIEGDTGVYDTHVIHKVTDGQDSVTSYIWCPNGNAIKNDSMSSINIEGVMFNGSSNITTSVDAKYKWEKKVGASWVVIKNETAGNANGHIISVNQADIPSMLVVRCTMKYKSITQIDSIVIEDIIDPVQATIFSTSGNTFKNGTGDTFLIAKAIRNAIEEDIVRLVSSISGVTGIQGEIIYNKGDKKYYKYNNNAWVVMTNPPSAGTEHQFDYIWTRTDKDGNIDTGWKQTGKILYVQSNDISQKAVYMVDIES